MAETKPTSSAKKEEATVLVPISLLEEIQRKQGDMEQELEGVKAKNTALEEAQSATLSGAEKPGLREKKTFEPSFRTARIRQFPNKEGKMDYVVGWTDRGAYQEVDRTGLSPQVIDFIDLIFLDRPKEAMKAKLLDFINNSRQVRCKIVGDPTIAHHGKTTQSATGETIAVTLYNQEHGMVETGDVVDGVVTHAEIPLTLILADQNNREITIDSRFVNQ